MLCFAHGGPSDTCSLPRAEPEDFEFIGEDGHPSGNGRSRAVVAMVLRIPMLVLLSFAAALLVAVVIVAAPVLSLAPQSAVPLQALQVDGLQRAW